MRDAKTIQFLKAAANIVGALGIALGLWIAGPLIAIGDAHPLEGELVRAAIAAAVLVAAALAFGWRWYRRRQSVGAIAAAMTDQGSSGDGDAAILKQRMREALARLRKSAGVFGRDALYDLPWYVIIGPPGSGKTTALINSGLKFSMEKGKTPQAVAGVAGTRHCDWWFTDDAVLVDTAGRYTTQDSDAKADSASWIAFLALLRKYRPSQPLNGVIVAISITDLVALSAAQLAAHQEAIRKRLAELHEQLGIEFPVYVVLTKADLIAGFTEFFGNLSEAQRHTVWGHTFPTADRKQSMIGEVPGEYDRLLERLSAHLPDRLQAEPNLKARVSLIGFPNQMAAMRLPVLRFLTGIFDSRNAPPGASLRGFYFTSGTQEGTPIDQLLGSMIRTFNAQDVPARAFSGSGKSYFLRDLLGTVITGEAGWVSTNPAVEHRRTILRAVGFAVIGVVAVAVLATLWVSYSRNRDVIDATEKALDEYQAAAAPLLRETSVADRNFIKVLPVLHRMRNMPAGYGSRDEAATISSGFGLSQRERLQSAAETSYGAALERFFRPRLIFRLEEQIQANAGNAAFIYEALKVYLMLGGQAKPDPDLILAWMRRDWADNLFPGTPNAPGRAALEDHLAAMLDLETTPLVALNEPLIQGAQATLSRMSIAERAYELLRSQAVGPTLRDWRAVANAGPDVKLVFETVNGQDLESVQVPYFFTYDGFHVAFLPRLSDIGAQIDRERWVLGRAGQQTIVQAQFATLSNDLLAIYSRDFNAAWKQSLGNLKLRSITSDKPTYAALGALSSRTSPIVRILESIRDQTELTKPRASPDPGDSASQAGTERGPDRSLSATPPALEPRRTDASPDSPGADIERMFKPFHAALDGDAGRRPVDAVIDLLRDVFETLTATAPGSSQTAATSPLLSKIASLRAISSRFPAPFDGMITAAANDVEADASAAVIAKLRQSLGDEVSRACEQLVPNRYPFTKASTRDMPLPDFARVFAPNGIMDRFLAQSLASYVDQKAENWTWRQDSRIARSLSAATLREFQRAAFIRDAFFPGGGNTPAFTMTVTPLTLPGDAANAKFDINGIPVMSQQGGNAPTSVAWPGSGTGRAVLTLGIGASTGGFFSTATTAASSLQLFERQGIWSLFRFLDASTLQRQGDNVVASLAANGREVSYQFAAGGPKNPAWMAAFRDFRCPAGL